MDSLEQDRRETPRYELHMRLQYRVLQGVKVTWQGVGRTCDFSRKAIRFVTPRRLPVDHRVELIIDWPVRFGEIYPLELCVAGTILRSHEGEAVARLTSWQFRVAPSAAAVERVPEAAHADRAPERAVIPISSYM